jgi:UDP-2,3-diacylglucosamine hydrolase
VLDGIQRIGLIAGSGVLPRLFAEAARRQGLSVVAVAHRGETDPSLETFVDHLSWVRVGQLRRIARTLRDAHVQRAVMAGGISHVRAIHDWRPDLGALRVMSKLRSFRDDALLRGIADYFASEGITLVAATDYLKDVLAPEGHLAGPPMKTDVERDVALGLEVASLLGRADTGQTVVVKGGHVLALEAVEGTDQTILRGGQLGGKGAVVVKLCKPGQDERFDLPAVGLKTLETMAEVGAKALVIQADKTLLFNLPELTAFAERSHITVCAVRRPSG